MPLLNNITTPYAEAFLQICDATGETESVIPQARKVLEIWNGSSELREAMASPVLEPDAKKSALETIFGSEISPNFLNLLKLLSDRQRIGFLTQSLSAFWSFIVTRTALPWRPSLRPRP